MAELLYHYMPSGFSHGIDLNNSNVQLWLFGVPTAHILLSLIFRSINAWPTPTNRPSLNPKTNSRVSDMVAYNTVAGLVCCYQAYYGIICQFGFFGNTELKTLQNVQGESYTRFYGNSEMIQEKLMIPMFGYQLYNFILCFLMNDAWSLAMVGHHFFTGTLAFMGLFPYMHCKAVFFFGVAEFSNVFLTCRDFFKYIPDSKTNYPFLYYLSSILFGTSFIIVRMIMWPYFCYDFWMDSIYLIQSGNAHSNFVVISFLVANVFLTGLQFYWGEMIFAIMFGKNKKQNKQKKN
jgi:hypothetical protein